MKEATTRERQEIIKKFEEIRVFPASPSPPLDEPLKFTFRQSGFQTCSATLSSDMERTAARLANGLFATLQGRTNEAEITIVGFSDERHPLPGCAYRENHILSSDRAAGIARAMQASFDDHNVRPKIISKGGYGNVLRHCQDSDEACNADNRRFEMTLAMPGLTLNPNDLCGRNSKAPVAKQ